jgi:hypothetical protein
VEYKYQYVLHKVVRYLRVSSPLVFSYGCAVRLLGTVAADLRERVRLTPGAWCWQYVGCSIVLCGWLYSLGCPLASIVVCSLFAYLITLSFWSLARRFFRVLCEMKKT